MSSARRYPVAPHNSLGLQTIPRPEAQNTEQIVIVARRESMPYVKFREFCSFIFCVIQNRNIVIWPYFRRYLARFLLAGATNTATRYRAS